MIRKTLVIFALLFLLASLATAGKKKSSQKPDAQSTKVVDEGSFGVFQNGQRIATETFTIRQYPGFSVTSSDFHTEAANNGVKLDQSSELSLLPDGSLSRYEWKQSSPDRSSAVVEPKDQLLQMHINADGKSSDQPFFLLASAAILDDYFFAQREVLLWRYLATSCRARQNGDGCDLVRAHFPILVPRRRTSSQVFIEFKGYEDAPLNGRPQHLRHFLMQTEGPDWHLWLDSDMKLLRISIPDISTEVLRQN